MASAFTDVDGAPPVHDAFVYCERLAKTHYENFNVASVLLPRALRPDFHAIYAFCRRTDDLGDEADGDRLALLDAWEAELSLIDGGTPSDPILVALQDVVSRRSIEMGLFRRLIQANRMDQGNVRFETYEDLLHYCEHSATPVGRMVLGVIGDRSKESARLSDATCTALQLANFWQDVRRDYGKDRIYVPLEDMRHYGVTEDDFAAAHASTQFRHMLAFEVERAQELFKQGLPLASRMQGRLKLDIALFSKGGLRVLDAIRALDYDVLGARPTVTPGRKAWIVASTALRLAVLRQP